MFLNVNISVKVFVHEAHGLPGGDLPDPPDPYVKVQFSSVWRSLGLFCALVNEILRDRKE